MVANGVAINDMVGNEVDQAASKNRKNDDPECDSNEQDKLYVASQRHNQHEKSECSGIEPQPSFCDAAGSHIVLAGNPNQNQSKPSRAAEDKLRSLHRKEEDND